MLPKQRRPHLSGAGARLATRPGSAVIADHVAAAGNDVCPSAAVVALGADHFLPAVITVADNLVDLVARGPRMAGVMMPAMPVKAVATMAFEMAVADRGVAALLVMIPIAMSVVAFGAVVVVVLSVPGVMPGIDADRQIADSEIDMTAVLMSVIGRVVGLGRQAESDDTDGECNNNR